MSIQFVLGPSGAGKSTYIENQIIKLSLEQPDKKFLLIVPDQFNMQTQKDMILMHPNHAFSNIEVLSFSRLSHRILEEVGGEEIPVLDDTGKSLIIRHIAESVRPELTVMKNKLSAIGFVHEVKSAISEFMQYGIRPDDVKNLADNAAGRKTLAGKLKDLSVIYRAFMQYKADSYITKEETLDKVKSSLHKSELVRDAYIYFDGFTGFTPIQESVIQELMVLARQVVFSFVLDEGINPYVVLGEQELFWLTFRSINRLKAKADEASINEDDVVYITRKDNIESIRRADIAHLERNIFRYPVCTYAEQSENINIYRASNIKEEIVDTLQRIQSLTLSGDYRYKDIAIVTGNLGEYADDMVDTADAFGIPVYMDYSRSVLLSPFIEALRASFDVIASDFSTESVIRFLRTGLSDLDREACDELENYLLRTGRRGYNSYLRTWTVNYSASNEESEAHREARLALADRVNNYRQYVADVFDGLHNLYKKGNTPSSLVKAEEYSRAIYEIMSKCGMYQKLLARAERFDEAGNLSRASEYRQVYGKVVDLLDQIVSLVGEEEMSLKEYRDILEAGFGEIKLGVIPQESDVVTVGDITRSRLGRTKIVFFLGVNDSNIPGAISSGGIISDLDREYIHNFTDIEIAPTPREQIFTQRLYLYMNLSKPTDKLYISYVQMDMEGKSMQPSYLISTLCKLYPQLIVVNSTSTHKINDRYMPAAKHLIQIQLADLLREYIAGDLSEEDTSYMLKLDDIMCSQGLGKVSADIHYISTFHRQNNPIASDIAKQLYGKVINTSISRLERFASCAYAHFLAYGMRIRPRTVFGFERRDMGDIYHKVLEEFAHNLESQGISWKDYSPEVSHAMVDAILDDLVKTYGETVLLSSSRTLAMTKRLGRILKRTVDGIQYQVKQGEFIPSLFEQGFFDSVSLGDSNDTGLDHMNISGKIDRIDICESDGNKYLRIVDYKSGNRDFEINALYYGLSLQLSVYMEQALKKIKDSKAAGMLYYHIDDPMISSDSELADEQIASLVLGQLSMNGVISDNPVMIGLQDSRLKNQAYYTSDVIPAGYKKDGFLKASSSTLSDDDFAMILKYARKELCKLTTRILDGEIAPIPCAMDEKKLPCNYCDYKSICPIKSGTVGFEHKILPKLDDSDVLAQMREELDS